MSRNLALYLLTVASIVSAFSARLQAQSMLTHHMRDAVLTGEAPSIAALPANQIMNLDFVLALHDQAGLELILIKI